LSVTAISWCDRFQASICRTAPHSTPSVLSLSPGRVAWRRRMRAACADIAAYPLAASALRESSRDTVDGTRPSLRDMSRRLTFSAFQISMRMRSSGCNCR
jgi:hypothetical protein